MDEVFIVDALTAQPGAARTVLQRYLDDYAPGALRRGMVLRHRWISPPPDLGDGGGNLLSFTWAVAGTQAWWRQRLAAVADPSVAQFWTALQPLVAHRTRRVHGRADPGV